MPKKLAFTIGLIAGIPCIVVGATNMGDNKGFVALLVFGIVGTVLGFYGSPLMWTRLATVNQELTVVQAVTQEHLYTVADLAQRLSVNGKTASDTLNNCIRKGYLVGYIREGDRLVLNENRALGPTQYTLVCSHCGATVELTKGDTAAPTAAASSPTRANADAHASRDITHGRHTPSVFSCQSIIMLKCVQTCCTSRGGMRMPPPSLRAFLPRGVAARTRLARRRYLRRLSVARLLLFPFRIFIRRGPRESPLLASCGTNDTSLQKFTSRTHITKRITALTENPARAEEFGARALRPCLLNVPSARRDQRYA